MLHDVRAAVYLGGYLIELEFAEGKRGTVDFSTYLARGGVFERFKDIEFFRAFHVNDEVGVLAWDDEIEVAPESLYAQATGSGLPAWMEPEARSSVDRRLPAGPSRDHRPPTIYTCGEASRRPTAASRPAPALHGVGAGEYSEVMKPTIEAEVDAQGNIRPRVPVTLPPGSRLLITVVALPTVSEPALLSEASLATDWDRPEEDAAWAGLGPA